MTEPYEATKIEKAKCEVDESDVEALIQGAIKELETTPAKKEAGSKVETFKATPFTAPASPTPTPTPKSENRPAAPKPITAKQPTAEESAYDKTFKQYKPGDIVKGAVVKVDPSGVLVDIRYNADGIILPEEIDLNHIPKVGDVIDVFIEKLENKDGYVELSQEKAQYEVKWNHAFEAYKNKTVLDARVTNVVKGGLVVDCDGIPGFVPASQVGKSAEVSLDTFKDQTIPVKIIELNRRQGKVIMSHKFAAGEKSKQSMSKLFNELAVGQVRHGTVSSLKNFGAFVNLGGVEGLIHLSELSWKRVKHPSDMLKVGQELDVFVLGVDKVNHKVALGLKELQTDPWETAKEKYKVGQIVKARVARLVKFGAFVELDDALEGLVHVSELSTKNVRNPEDAVKPGDIVEVKVLRILPDEQKIGLSIKEAMLDKERAEAAARRAEDTKVTIGQMIAEKERQKAEKETEETPEPPEGPPEAGEQSE